MTLYFTCPFCTSVSHNPYDEEQKYCPRCKVFVNDVLETPANVRRDVARAIRVMSAMTQFREQGLRTAQAWEFGLNRVTDGTKEA